MNPHVSRLRADVEALATPAGRMVGTPGHEVAKTYLVQRLHALGLDPYRGDSFALPYEVGRHAFTNLVGVAPGRDPELAPVLIGAHYDTAGRMPGADDNAAAVAIALVVAERLLEEPAERSVLIALFDTEELEVVMRRAQDRSEVRLVTALNRYVGDMSDHHVFRLAEVPFLFLTCGRWEHYHRVGGDGVDGEVPDLSAEIPHAGPGKACDGSEGSGRKLSPLQKGTYMCYMWSEEDADAAIAHVRFGRRGEALEA